MTMFFGFMGLLIFAGMGPLLLILWCARASVPPARLAARAGCLRLALLNMLVAAGRQRHNTCLVPGSPINHRPLCPIPPTPTHPRLHPLHQAVGRGPGRDELAHHGPDGGQGAGGQCAVRLPVGARHPAAG